MHRFGMMALAAAGLFLASVVAALAAPPQIQAPHALLIEAESGTVLFEKAADDLVAPASLAKLMTVNVVFDQLQLGNIRLDDEYVISENAWRKGGAPSRGSTMFAALHSRVKVAICSRASSSSPPTTAASRSPKASPATKTNSCG